MENHKFDLIKSILDLVFKIKLYYYDKHITLKEHNVFVRKNLTKNIFILKVNNYYTKSKAGSHECQIQIYK